MSGAKDALEAKVVGVAATAEAALVAAQRLVEYRDRTIREARQAGVSAIVLGKLAGLSRPRVYEILHRPDEDDEGWDWDGFATEMDDRWAEASYSWDKAGQVGAVEDYFPLDEAISDAL